MNVALALAIFDTVVLLGILAAIYKNRGHVR